MIIRHIYEDSRLDIQLEDGRQNDQIRSGVARDIAANEF